MVDGMRLLVVEDEQPMAAMLHRGLTEDGYSVDVTGERYEAVWQATEFDYDAVVLNLMLRAWTVSRCAANCGRQTAGCLS